MVHGCALDEIEDLELTVSWRNLSLFMAYAAAVSDILDHFSLPVIRACCDLLSLIHGERDESNEDRLYAFLKVVIMWLKANTKIPAEPHFTSTQQISQHWRRDAATDFWRNFVNDILVEDITLKQAASQWADGKLVYLVLPQGTFDEHRTLPDWLSDVVLRSFATYQPSDLLLSGQYGRFMWFDWQEAFPI